MNTEHERGKRETESRSESQSRRPPWRGVLGPPSTRIGWWSFGLMTAWLALTVLFQVFVATERRLGDTFFSNPWLWITMLSSAACAVVGGAVSAVAIIWKRERSLLVILTLLWGIFILLFAIGTLSNRS